MSDKTKIILVMVLAGAALLIVAGPIGNWIARVSAPVEIQEASAPSRVSKASAASPLPLPQLHLKREMVKPQVPSDETAAAEEPTLPPPHASSGGSASTSVRTLTNDEIDAALQQRQPQFLRCWTQRLKDNPNLAGKMDVQFEIFPRGKVQGVRVIDSTIEDDTMSRCIVSVLERIQFREFRGASITLTFPLRFE